MRGGTSQENCGSLELFGKDHLYAGYASLIAQDSNNRSQMIIQPDGTFTITYNNITNKNIAMQEDTVPRSGGAVMNSVDLGRINNTGEFRLHGGTTYNDGSSVVVYGKNSVYGYGRMFLHPSDGTNEHAFSLEPNGSLIWTGQPIQYTSDKRLKQKISEIDNALLDAWQDVEPVQFKYNDAVEEKGDNARLHTGYVVQQIDEACQKHNIDISEYGLYCHEEYPERTEEVTIENEDGTTTKEVKVIEPAKEHYSLRYTETLVVECAFLRRENDKLKQRFKQLEETVNELKSSINYSEIPNS